MNIVIGILLAVILLAGLLLIMPARVWFSFSYSGSETAYDIFVGIGKIRLNVKRFLQKKPEKPKAPSTEEKKKLSFRDIENAMQKGMEAIRYLKKKFTINLFSLKVRMSLGDAADTGIATGAAYGSVYALLGAADRYFVLKKHEVVITPVFQGVGLEAVIRGEFQLRVIHCLGLINKIRKEDVK